LRAQHVRQIVVSSRTRATAEGLARQIDAEVAEWTAREEALVAADIVVTATGAPHAILSRAQVAQAMRSRRERPLFIIDIALPRAVESDVGSLEQVFLYNVDDLQGVVNENLGRRGSELARATEIVEEEAGRFAAWLQSRDIIPTVVALRERFESIRQTELRRLQTKMTALPPEAQAQVEHVTKLIVEKLLLTPTEQLKAVSDDALASAYTEALHRLFSLPSPDPPAGSVEPPQPRKIS
jgi:glutamyl-tRNA reductase